MNIWTKRSIDIANQRDYLDQLFKVYPLSANERRELDPATVTELKRIIAAHDSKKLINLLLDQVKGKDGETHPFPIKYSYVSYLKNDRSAIERNPKTVERIAGYLYDMGIDGILDKTSAPKETNRQMGPLFKNYIDQQTLGLEVVKDERTFMVNDDKDMIYNCSDAQGEKFAKDYLGYKRDKGLDFIARVNNTYIIGETKFLTDFGGHQDAQLNDAIDTLNTPLTPTSFHVKRIAIIDGVCYIKSNNKMYKTITTYPDDAVILSATLLREFLGSL